MFQQKKKLNNLRNKCIWRRPVVLVATANVYNLKEKDTAKYNSRLGKLQLQQNLIRQHFLLSALRFRFVKVVPLGNTSSKKILDSIEKYADRLIMFHFSAHMGEGKILMKSSDDEDILIAYTAFHEALKKASCLRLVILNGCETHNDFILKLNKRNYDLVVIKNRVPESIAAEFTKEFYRYLKYGYSLTRSFSFSQIYLDSIRGTLFDEVTLAPTIAVSQPWEYSHEKSKIVNGNKDSNNAHWYIKRKLWIPPILYGIISIVLLLLCLSFIADRVDRISRFSDKLNQGDIRYAISSIPKDLIIADDCKKKVEENLQTFMDVTNSVSKVSSIAFNAHLLLDEVTEQNILEHAQALDVNVILYFSRASDSYTKIVPTIYIRGDTVVSKRLEGTYIFNETLDFSTCQASNMYENIAPIIKALTGLLQGAQILENPNRDDISNYSRTDIQKDALQTKMLDELKFLPKVRQRDIFYFYVSGYLVRHAYETEQNFSVDCPIIVGEGNNAVEGKKQMLATDCAKLLIEGSKFYRKKLLDTYIKYVEFIISESSKTCSNSFEVLEGISKSYNQLLESPDMEIKYTARLSHSRFKIYLLLNWPSCLQDIQDEFDNDIKSYKFGELYSNLLSIIEDEHLHQDEDLTISAYLDLDTTYTIQASRFCFECKKTDLHSKANYYLNYALKNKITSNTTRDTLLTKKFHYRISKNYRALLKLGNLPKDKADKNYRLYIKHFSRSRLPNFYTYSEDFNKLVDSCLMMPIEARIDCDLLTKGFPY